MNLIKSTFLHYQKHNASRMGASLAYYTIFAIVPLSLLLINIGIFFFSKSTVEYEIIKSFSNITGPHLENYFRSIISSIPSGFGILSIIINLVIAVGVFSVLKKDINELWDTEADENKDLIERTKYIVREKFIAFSLLPILALLMIVSISFGIIYSSLKEYLNIYSSFSTIVNILGYSIPIIFSTIFFAFVYKIFPKVKLPWSEIWLGAFVTTILFVIGNIFIGQYLYILENASIFSVVGTFAALLAWVYYSSQAFFLGASFTYVYSKSKGYLNENATYRD